MEGLTQNWIWLALLGAVAFMVTRRVMGHALAQCKEVTRSVWRRPLAERALAAIGALLERCWSASYDASLLWSLDMGQVRRATAAPS